jgi:hypothetical protein
MNLLPGVNKSDETAIVIDVDVRFEIATSFPANVAFVPRPKFIPVIETAKFEDLYSAISGVRPVIIGPGFGGGSTLNVRALELNPPGF